MRRSGHESACCASDEFERRLYWYGLPRAPLGKGFAVDVLHGKKELRALLTNAVDVSDIRMIDLRLRTRFANEEIAVLASLVRCAGGSFKATVRSSARLVARYSSPMPPAPSSASMR